MNKRRMTRKMSKNEQEAVVWARRMGFAPTARSSLSRQERDYEHWEKNLPGKIQDRLRKDGYRINSKAR